MMPFLGIVAFGFTLATLIVPAGSQAVGRLIELLGIGLQRHGEALSAACREYMRQINGGVHWYTAKGGWTPEGIAEQKRRAEGEIAE